MEVQEINRYKELIAKFMGEYTSEYKVSTIKDINGNFIKEGDIINADGYKSDIVSEEICVHCVEFLRDKNLFGSDIYRDFDPLHTYKNIEVIGHVETFRHICEHGNWSGNLGAALKDFPAYEFEYNTSWDELFPVVDKIAEIASKDKAAFDYLGAEKNPKNFVLFRLPVDVAFEETGKFLEWYNEKIKA